MADCGHAILGNNIFCPTAEWYRTKQRQFGYFLLNMKNIQNG